ncbi:MAG TPA: DinB family protein [Symbiobacteriaceae bacterium]|nr:DinB family protein [Symbiobacteriaceae bacterium]
MDVTYLSRHLGYNAWATRKVLGALRSLTEEEFTRDLSASFSSIRGTIAHMFGGDWFWYNAWTREKFPPPPWLDTNGEGATFAAMEQEYLAVLGRHDRLAEQLRDPARAAELAFRAVDPHNEQVQAWHVMLTVVNHNSYHRGQIVTLLRQLGHRPEGIDTDLIRYMYESEGKVYPY